jgi:4-amino-4-deoxy-L-arabinose transferase-like glycosyltransferase
VRHSSTHLATGPDRATGAAVVLLLLYIPFGLFGREPWKADEAYSFGIVYSMLVDQQWLVPTLAGEPFIEKPPVMYLLAAAFAKLTHHWLPLHEGARLAVVAMLFGTAYCIARAARSIGGQRAVPMALVALVSCVGLTVHARMMITDLAVLAGYAMAYLGLTYAIQQRPRAALWLGVGTGLGFLAKGFFAPALIGMTALFLPASVHAVRQNFASYCWVLVRSLIWMSPFFLLWPSLLFMYAPELFHQWFWDNNIGRFTGSSVDRLGASGDLAFVARTLAWYCFPVIPLALIYEIRHRAHQRRHSPDRVPLSDSDGLALTSVLVTVAVLSLSASARVNYFMPLAVPACVWAACVLSRDSPMASQDTYLSR